MRTIIFLVMSIVSFNLVAEEQPLVLSTKRLTMESALTIAQGAIDECRKKGIQVGVTVVDRNGQPQVMLRDVLAPFIAVEVSMKKAITAASFTAATSSLKSQAQGSLAHMDNMMFGAGGLPVQAAGEMFGGVGVSGAPGGEIDEECAQAGINTIIDDLEMM